MAQIPPVAVIAEELHRKLEPARTKWLVGRPFRGDIKKGEEQGFSP
jgi:hypothetical protein